jgi:microcystin-dependent protein
MPDLPLTVTAGALPVNLSYTPQEFADALVARMKISTSQAYSLFTSGAVLPTSDTGPHFLTTESTWYYFDYQTGNYQPIKLQPKSLRYIISPNAPSSQDYDVWYRVAADGTPLDIRKFQNGQWTPYPIDYANVSNRPNIAPIGEIIMWPTASAPLDFLVCNGQTVLRGQYSDLFNVIGTTYGAGDGSTTFNLPDLRGRAPVGIGSGDATDATAWSIAQKRGAEGVTLTPSNIPDLKAQTKLYSTGYGFEDAQAPDPSDPDGYFTLDNTQRRTNTTNDGLGVNILNTNIVTNPNEATAVSLIQPSLGINFIIRYKNTT